ncbi:MAG: NAD(P)H-dependent oxidoreductase, partial [Gammaproteobacteria bacterium]|nr:NAD(P)H-dependent oxidoreductase [Gammaproteobacteria bacterium]
MKEMKEQFIEMMNFRHACKVFDENKKISDDDFQYILESARLSPSSFGFEPWHFLVVQDPALRDKLK